MSDDYLPSPTDEELAPIEGELVVVAPSEVDVEALVELALQAEEEAEQAREDVLSTMARTVESKLSSRMGARKIKEAQWLESLRLYLGSLANYNTFSGEQPFGVSEKREDDNKPEVNITRNKCETAIAQTMAFQFAAGDKNWNLRPPQVLDVDDDDMQLMQDAQGQPMSREEVVNAKIALMEQEMEAHLENTRYGIECRRAGWDRVVLGTGIVKAPTNSTQLRKAYQKVRTTDGRTLRVPVLREENVPSIYRVNPWYFFPDDSVVSIADAEDSIEVHPLSKTQLRDYIKNPGYMPDQIALCLEEEPAAYPNSPFTDPAYLTQGTNLLRDRYLVLEFHGPMKRSDLELLGKEPLIESPLDEYFVEVWVCNNRVIRLEFSNLEGCYRVPYACTPWEPDPGSIFGFGIPMLIRDQQRVVNETYKMLLDNAGISAGPQVIVDTTLIKPADGGLECTPWKVWYAQEYGADVSKAIQFFMPQNAFEGLSAMFNMAMGLADNESSIPNLSIGIGAPTGASDSATGMAIAQQNAASPLFYKSEQWDDEMTKPLISMLYDWEMQYNEKDEIKGTFDVDVRTSTAFLQSAVNQQKLERLRMEISQGSPLAEWLNMDELAQVSLMDMRLPYKTLIKSPEEVAAARAAQPPPPPDPQMITAQANMEKVQNDKARIQLEMQKLQVEMKQKHDEAIMKYNAQARTDEVRSKEAEATVMKAQYDFRRELAQLAAQDEQHRDKIVASLQTEEMRAQTQKFLAGANLAAKARQQNMDQKELEFKRTSGKPGI